MTAVGAGAAGQQHERTVRDSAYKRFGRLKV